MNNFTTINVCDFEYEVADGDLPDVLCLVAYVLDENLRHVRTIRLWRGILARRHHSISDLTHCSLPTPHGRR
jgi:hypothetical protein